MQKHKDSFDFDNITLALRLIRKQRSTNVILVEIECVFSLLHSNVSFASMVRDQITLVCAFSWSVEYIAGQKRFCNIRDKKKAHHDNEQA